MYYNKMEHFNLSPGAAAEMRVSHPPLLESLARAALRKVPNSEAVLQKHFAKGDVQPSHPLYPPPIRPQKLYSGYGTV